MKQLLSLVLLLVASVVFAAPVPPDVRPIPMPGQKTKTGSFSLDRVPIGDFLHVVYRDFLGSNYVLDPVFADRADAVSVHLDNVQASTVRESVRHVVASVGGELVELAGFDLIRAKAKVETADRAAWDLFFYRPQNRPVSHFVDLLSGAFEGQFISGARSGSGFSMSGGTTGAAGSGGARGGMASGSGAVPAKVQSNGTDGAAIAVPAAASSQSGESDFLVFSGPPGEFKRLKAALVTLDVPRPEILVKAYLFEVSDLTAQETGLSLIVDKPWLKAGIGSVLRAGNFLSFATGGIELIAKNLLTDSRFKVVSNPLLVVKSGSQAKLTIGDQVPVRTGAVVDRNGNPVESVEYRQSGVQLVITPTLRESGRVDLDVSQTLSQFQENGSTSPALMNRELKTYLSAGQKQTVVLAGLRQSKDNRSSSGLSFLPWRFTNSSSSGSTEFVLMFEVEAQPVTDSV